jgi:predicted ArsR family transcriptional regulator
MNAAFMQYQEAVGPVSGVTAGHWRPCGTTDTEAPGAAVHLDNVTSSSGAPRCHTQERRLNIAPQEHLGSDLSHVDLAKNLRRVGDLRHNDVVKNVGAAEGPTRGQVARLILELGPSTAATLGGRLGLTPAAIRRHLDNLLAEGLIETRTARTYGNRGRGRPAKVFVITDAGRSAFEHAYDDLATSALRFLAEVAGPEAVAEFARRQVAELERRYLPVMASAGEDKVAALAEALSADGYAASASSAPVTGGGEQLCQHHCPVAHVAAEFPQLCEAETKAFERLLGTHVQRLATIARGDAVCTTHIPSTSVASGRTRA